MQNGGPGLKAFPAGFKMVSGNPAARSLKCDPSTKHSSHFYLIQLAGIHHYKDLRASCGSVLFSGHAFVMEPPQDITIMVSTNFVYKPTSIT